MNRTAPSGTAWHRHKAKARRQRRRRESHGRTQYRGVVDAPGMNSAALHRRQQLTPAEYTQ